ncbi:MAG: hypothetical protein ACM65L_14680 [Microcoleus sp.]
MVSSIVLLYPKELVKAAKKCLKPGGTLIISTPYHGSLKNLILAITGKMNNHFTVLWDNDRVNSFRLKLLPMCWKLNNIPRLILDLLAGFPIFGNQCYAVVNP